MGDVPSSDRDAIFKKLRAKPENKTMLVGGNQRARQYFKQHGWYELGSDKIEQKYTSPAAQRYRKELEKEVAKLKASPKEQILEPPKPQPAPEAAAPPSAAVTSESRASTSAPVNGQLADGSAAEGALEPASSGEVPAAAPAVRKPAGKGPLKLSKAKAKTGGLGVKRMTTKVDDSVFEQAPAETVATTPVALSTEEKKEVEKASAAASRFAYNQLAEEDEAVKAPSVKRGKDGHLTLGGADDFWTNPTGSMKSTRTKPDSDGKASSKAAMEEEDAARRRFGNAKSISSSQFQDNNEGANDYENQTRLSRFTGATAISSADFYGENEEGGPRGRQGGRSSYDLADMNANEMMSRLSIQARQDFQQMSNMAGQAGRKLSNMASSFLKDLQGSY